MIRGSGLGLPAEARANSSARRGGSEEPTLTEPVDFAAVIVSLTLP